WPVRPGLVGDLGAWLVLAVGFTQASRGCPDLERLHRIAFAYFTLELGIITAMVLITGMADWLALLFFLVTLLYAHMVLPHRAALAISTLTALVYTALAEGGAVDQRQHTGILSYIPISHHPVLLGLATLAGFALIGFTVSQFALMFNRQAEALQVANQDLGASGEELRLHRNHLEDLVLERTQDLVRANAELLRVNELKSGFLASVSHEMRTPLTSIRSFSEILLNYPDEDEGTRHEFLEIIIKESDRLTRLINDVLDLARIEAGKLELAPVPVTVADLVVPTLDVIQVMATHKGLRLLNLVPDELPEVLADTDRIRQVLTNLLSNAVKFTEAGTIRVGAERRGDEVAIFVSDTGPGIRASEQKRIFEKFHQGGNGLTAKPEGSGLGLAICQEIMQRHGGRIWVED